MNICKKHRFVVAFTYYVFGTKTFCFRCEVCNGLWYETFNSFWYGTPGMEIP